MINEQIIYKEKYEVLSTEFDHLKSQYDYLKLQLAELRRLVYGAKSERFVPAVNPQQLSLEINIADDLLKSGQQQILTVEKHERKKSKQKKEYTSRMIFPAHLQREEIYIYPEGFDENSTEKIIGKEVTEVLEMIEAKYFVKQYIRPKYEQKEKSGIAIGELPTRIIDKGLFGENLIAQIICDKYVDHLPLYRQLQRFERAGIKIASSTVGDTVTRVCDAVEPLYDLLKQRVLQSDYLQADETPIKVMDSQTKGKTHRGYHWVYHAPKEKLVLFDYRAGRGREGPEEILKNFRGYLQNDGYAVYNFFERNAEVVQLNCMAHARRYFEKAREYDPVRCEVVLGMMQILYRLEREIREGNFTDHEILSLRKEKSVPVLAKIKEWMENTVKENRITPQSPLGKALIYTIPRWEKLCAYTQQPFLQIDNNPVENAIRPVALGRKNYLFAGSHDGAKRAAMIYSFFGSCKMNNVNPKEWFAYMITHIRETKISQLHTLLPAESKNQQ